MSVHYCSVTVSSSQTARAVQEEDGDGRESEERAGRGSGGERLRVTGREKYHRTNIDFRDGKGISDIFPQVTDPSALVSNLYYGTDESYSLGS